jgi:chromosome segregation ATPase
MGDQERFADALEEQEEFFADSNHLGNAEEILQELEASSIGQDQTDTENLRQRLVTISEKEPQVHGRLASAIASWKQYDVLYDELENGAIQCRRDLATLQGMPAAVSPQEVTDKITQLNNVNERNSQLFSIVQALREQIELLASLATLEQHKNISNAVDALYNGLEETSRTIEDLKIHLKDHLENADKRAKSVERHCEKLELTARELDAKVSSLPDIEDNLGQLSELPLSLEAISNELEGYKEELETLQQMARNVEGCLDSTVIEKLQGLNRHLDDLSAGVAGKNAEVSAAAKRVQEVTEKLDVVENEINALSSKFEGLSCTLFLYLCKCILFLCFFFLYVSVVWISSYALV